MKLNTESKAFKDTLARLSSLPGATTGVPVTQAVILEADMEGLKMTRFSAEAKISITLESVSIEDADGSFSTNHGALMRIANLQPSKELILASDEKFLRFKSGRYESKIAIVPSFEVEFPDQELETESVKMPVELLVRALQFVSPAVSTNETQKGLCGVCVRATGDKLAIIGGDGKSLHAMFIDYELAVDSVLAKPSVDAILKTVGEQAGACSFAIGENMASLVGHDYEINVALLNENFPNVEKILTQDESSIRAKVRVDRNEMANAFKTAGGITDDQFVQVEVTKKEMKIIANGSEESEMIPSLDCKATKPVDFRVSSLRVQQGIATFAEKDEIEIIVYQNTIMMKESDRTVVIALQFKPTE